MNTIFYIVAAAILTGCGATMSSAVPSTEFQPLSAADRLTNRTIVTWDRVDDVDKICRTKGVKVATDTVIYGCAFYDKNSCKIITGTTTTMPILGHEIRHCFEGNFHD